MANLEILIGDCRDVLKQLPDESINCVVTSPPYFGLRDYGHDGQIGLEPTPDEFVETLVSVFREVRRVLRKDGTVWLNLGDSYTGYHGNKKSEVPSSSTNGWTKGYDENKRKGRPQDIGLKQKELIGIPWRVAFALQADGWYLRQDIIWAKPNPMPESVRDRCTKAHEYIFLLSKSPKYYYDHEAAKEPMAASSIPRLKQNVADQVGTTRANGGAKTNGNFKAAGDIESGLRNRRSVWSITTKPYKGAHFATFPPDLIEPCILAGCPEFVCSDCGSPYSPVHKKTDKQDESYKGSSFSKGKTAGRTGGDRTQKGDRFISLFEGYEPTCKCEHTPIPGTVLDPFGGSGTTGGVALKNQRNAILVEINEKYAELIPERVHKISGFNISLTVDDEVEALI